MSSPDHAVVVRTGAKPDVVMVVSDICDGEVQHCVNQLRLAELQVEVIADVYAATARLAQGAPIAKVLVDARTLDDKELAFLRLVPHFFPACEIIVPVLPGLQDRVVFHATGVRVGPVEKVIDSLIGNQTPVLRLRRTEPESEAPPVSAAQEQWHAAETEVDAAVETEEPWESASEAGEVLEERPPMTEASQEEASGVQVEPGPGAAPESSAQEQWPAEEPVQAKEQRRVAADSELPAATPLAGGTSAFETPGHDADAPRLSTDGGPEVAGDEPSMYEVVRRRMAADQARAHRRTPPRNPPEKSKGPAPAVPIGEGDAPSRAELDDPLKPPSIGQSRDSPESPGPLDTEMRNGEQVEPMLSPDELDALLADRDAEDEGDPPWTDTRGKR